MEKRSGLITLPPAFPPHFVGSLVSGTGDDGIGWVQVGFFSGDECLRIDEHGDRTCLTIRRELMDTILGALTILLAANRWMQQADRRSASSEPYQHFAVEISVARRGQPGLVRCLWQTGTEGIERSHVDEQVNLRFREDLAQELASQLAHELGRVAAAKDE
jgi:hypothetical protein